MSRQFRKLTLQYAYLQLEKEEVYEICKEVEPKIREYLKNNYPEHYDTFFGKAEVKNPNSNKMTESDLIDDSPDLEDIEQDIENNKEPKNKDLKKLYRKIVEKTHPDKTGDNSKSDLFSDAVNAYESNDIAKMLDIAGKLNIEIVDLSPESVMLLKENIKTITSEIVSKKQTTGWAWYNAKENEEEKKRLIEFILKQKGIKL